MKKNKGEMLNRMATRGTNVAQFIYIEKDNKTKAKHAHIKGITDTNKPLPQLIKDLIDNSSIGKVNIRSFSEDKPKGNPFHMGFGKERIEEILAIVHHNAKQGLHSIINENLDVADGGVSGVILGNTIEFAPENTPRCVEEEGVCSLPLDLGMNLLHKVYGFAPHTPYPHNYRVEFSIHPRKEGVFEEHTVIWEVEKVHEHKERETHSIEFPNKFSEYIGDKAFGLLLADCLHMGVPESLILPRNIKPFEFGSETGSYEVWTRTAPKEKQAGLYYSGKGWKDPYELMEDVGDNLSSIIVQSAVNSKYSGAGMIRKRREDDIIEGIAGEGDGFMIGINNPQEPLPKEVLERVQQKFDLLRNYTKVLGEFTVEWAYDGNYVWILQLNQVKNAGKQNCIVEGTPCTEYFPYHITEGLEGLREEAKQIAEISAGSMGIKLIGNVGITSHFGDVLRKYNIPSYIEKEI